MQKTHTKIKHIIFDIGNVFLNFKPLEYFSTIEGASVICRKMFEHPLWLKYDKGDVTLYEIQDEYCKLWPEDRDLIIYLLTNWLDVLTPISYTFLKRDELIHEGYDIYLLSNLSNDAHKHIEKTYDIFQKADGYILSYEVHCIKPDAQIYKLLLDKYHLDPTACLFLDDSKKNVVAARALGIHAIHFEDIEEVEKQLNEELYVK